MDIITGEDTAFFDILYREHRRVLHAYLVGQCGDTDSAEDLLQETYVRVWRHLPELRAIPAERRRYYLFATARNLVIDSRRRQAVRQQQIAPPEPAFASDPAQAIIAQEMAIVVDCAIRELPPDLRTVLSLHLLGEMNSSEMGTALGIPAGTVRYRLSRARQMLAERLGVENDK